MIPTLGVEQSQIDHIDPDGTQAGRDRRHQHGAAERESRPMQTVKKADRLCRCCLQEGPERGPVPPRSGEVLRLPHPRADADNEVFRHESSLQT
jgi:hypothetical protein